MTREELERCLSALPPAVVAELNQRLDGFRDYLAKAQTVRGKLRSDYPAVDPRVVTAASLAIARFL